ncbi:selenide, water dikinase SelD [Leptolyngbya sp. PCC 6406]|uniref:selenide, water dikinase SelD n=1 Tax=Leptolyngbya sp. PCC 6406 TaxID=1173264 RepID=UPI0002AC59A0|nr:selenide, water dikinase SelD [Leptolyngbya sp. PCC 6406]
MPFPTPLTQDLVFVGGGHTHALVLRKFAMRPLAGVRLTLITNLVDTPYSGMLPCHISGLYDFDESHIDLRPLTRFAQCRLIMDRAVGLDLDRQQVLCATHPPVAYDVLSLDTGSTPATATVPGAAEYAIPAKPVPDLLRAWVDWLADIEAQNPDALSLGIVGGGVGGVELALNMQVRLWQLLARLGRSQSALTLHLFHRGEDIASGRNASTRRKLRRHFQERGIQLHLGESVSGVEAVGTGRRVRCESGLTVTCDRVFWVTQAAAPDWIQGTGLRTNDQGFVLVQDTLESCSHPQVFAAGDMATMVNHPRPKAGVFAVRQGPPLFHNLQARLLGTPLKPFRPQRQYLNIIDTGDGSAIASRGPFTWESPWMRAWKDRIDRRFMGLFSDFPPMVESPQPRPGRADGLGAALGIPGAGQNFPGPRDQPPSMYCAGCGSKVGQTVLSRALVRSQATVPSLEREDIVVGLTAPDDAAIVQLPPHTLAVQTVDFFRALVDDPFIFAQICVKHCLSDLYAMGATPQTALAMATIPYGSFTLQEETLFHLLAGAKKALAIADTALVGGHTTAGPDLSLGFACNGWVAPDAIWSKGGMEPGQVLILTQPLGTGTLFAADMQYRAKGEWIESAIAAMIQPNGPAAHILRHHGATACTDITGFGLLGHLAEMVEASQVGAELDLRDLPLLAGARETLAQGLVSSLQPQNLQVTRALSNGSTYSAHPLYGILFDPQTAGGLLASVPAAQATACLESLHAQGYTAAAIGTVVPLVAPTPPLTIRAW